MKVGYNDWSLNLHQKLQNKTDIYHVFGVTKFLIYVYITMLVNVSYHNKTAQKL